MLRLEGPPRPNRPIPAPAPGREGAADDAPARAMDPSAWRCRQCGAAITSTRHRVEVDGRHVHLKVNPSGFSFVFGCFREAPGCAVAGKRERAASWFLGCAWQYAMCGDCGGHLGWAFSGTDTFFGLVLERLVAPEDA